MKKKIFIVAGVILLLFVLFMGYQFLTTRSHSPLEKTAFSNQGLDINVSYCRPLKKGRLIFGDAGDKALLPNGKYWRLGANDATEITFSKNINFAGKPVSAGSYRMYAVPQADHWQVSLNSELGKFGFFEPNYAMDVVKVDVPIETLQEPVEQLTISFAKDSTATDMDFSWDKTKVRVPITVQ